MTLAPLETALDTLTTDVAAAYSAVSGRFSYPPNTTLSFIPTPVTSLPALRVPFRDPSFPDITIERVYDVPNVGNYYAKRQAFSKTGQWLFLGDGQAGTPAILDGSTYAVVNANVTGGTGIWSETEEDVVYRVTASTGAFFRFNPITNTNLGTLRTFSTYKTSPGVQVANQGSLSDDGRYILLTGKTSGGQVTLIVYDILADTFETAPVTTLPHAAGMSHSGEYVHVNWDTAGTGNENGIWLFDRHLTPIRQIAQSKAHADFAWDTSGDEVLVYLTTGSESIATGSYARMHRLIDGLATTIIRWNVACALRNGHVSGRNSARPGWIYMAPYLWTTSELANDAITAMKLDAAQPPTVQFFGHTHHLDTTQTFQAMPFAAPSRDGRTVPFHSEWGASPSTAYAFVARAA